MTLNALIDHCQTVIRARGRSSDRAGEYIDDVWRIRVLYDADGCALQVEHRGERVLRAQWLNPDEPGHIEAEPGAWRDALLRLPAAHS